MKRSIYSLLVSTIAIFFLLAGSSRAEVTPRLNFAGRGTISFDFTGSKMNDGTRRDENSVNFSDSSILLDAREKLYDEDLRGGFTLGLTFPEEGSQLGNVFYHQINAYITGKNFELRAGRIKLETGLIEFPTARDDDLIQYTNVRNPFSGIEDSEKDLYGDGFYLQFFPISPEFSVTLHAENLRSDPGAPVSRDPGNEMSSYGVKILFSRTKARRFDGLIREAGAGVLFRDVRIGEDRWMPVYLAGATVNITRDPIDAWDFRAQIYYTPGAGNPPPESELEESIAAAFSIRYLKSPYTLPKYQIALTGGYRHYSDSDRDSYSLVGNAFYRLGANFDVGLQYQESHASTGINPSGTRTERKLMALLIFNFDFVYNNYFDERDSILNVEHGYIP